MATRVTDARANAALDTLLTGVSKLSLHTGDPGAAGTLLELVDPTTAKGYLRQTISFDAAATHSKPSHAEINFLAAGGDWPSVTYVGLWNNTTFMASFALTVARQINDGQTLTFDALAITMAAAGG